VRGSVRRFGLGGSAVRGDYRGELGGRARPVAPPRVVYGDGGPGAPAPPWRRAASTASPAGATRRWPGQIARAAGAVPALSTTRVRREPSASRPARSLLQEVMYRHGLRWHGWDRPSRTTPSAGTPATGCARWQTGQRGPARAHRRTHRRGRPALPPPGTDPGPASESDTGTTATVHRSMVEAPPQPWARPPPSLSCGSGGTVWEIKTGVGSPDQPPRSLGGSTGLGATSAGHECGARVWAGGERR